MRQSKTLQETIQRGKQGVVTSFSMAPGELTSLAKTADRERLSVSTEKAVTSGLTEPSKLENDGELLSKVFRGDEQAMAVLFDRYSKIVYSVALRVLGDTASAEDVTQETFIKIWRNPNSFLSTRGSLGGWLAIVVRNRSIDMLRQKRPSDQIEELNLASACNLTDDAERSILIHQAWSAVKLLSTEQQKYMGMAFFEGLTYCEIAKVTGDPLGTVKTRIRSALSTLRKGFQV